MTKTTKTFTSQDDVVYELVAIRKVKDWERPTLVGSDASLPGKVKDAVWRATISGRYSAKRV